MEDPESKSSRQGEVSIARERPTRVYKATGRQINSPYSVDVNGIPRHIADVRPVSAANTSQSDDNLSRDPRSYDHEDHREL